MIEPCKYAHATDTPRFYYCLNKMVIARDGIVSESVCNLCERRNGDHAMRERPPGVVVVPPRDAIQPCRYRVPTGEFTKCDACGLRGMTAEVYACLCESVSQKKCTASKVSRSKRFASCLGCRFAEP